MDMLARELTTLAFCWRVERRDGVAIGLTSHDRDLPIDGLVHRAAPGMTPSAIRREGGLEADTMDVAGALTADAITRADLLAGRWDGARVRLFAVDWTGAPGRVELGEGRLGAVSLKEGGFSAELRGPGAALDRPVAEECSPECRAELGDRRCRVAMAGRRRFARVETSADATVAVDAVEPVPDAYGGGRLRWIGGANGGLESAVAASAGAVLTLRAPPVFEAAAGTLVELIEGCDKSLATCAARFGNAVNFRGEPFLPGTDLLMRYPVSEVEQAALAAVGAKFRLHGREADTGLDCVGLAALALRAGGCAAAVPTGYALRGGDPDAVAALLDARLTRVEVAAPGDLMLMRTGPGQLHLGIRTAAGTVHADAGLRRVVERPGAPAWPVLGVWRAG